MNNRLKTRKFTLVALLLLIAVLICGCADAGLGTEISSLSITNGGRIILNVGDTVKLETDLPDGLTHKVVWTSSNDSVSVTPEGLVTALEEGKAAVTVSYLSFSDTAMIEVRGKSFDDDAVTTDKATADGSNLGDDPSTVLDPYANVSKEKFYSEYTPASSYADAYYRTLHGFMSGTLTVPGQAPELSQYRPVSGDLYVRNQTNLYSNNNKAYTVTDAYGKEVFTVYKGGAYITLEEVAAYVYAFGDVPANYVSSKNADPRSSVWGEYLRLNHSAFSGSTKKYPYEPELPNISGCGGELYYYEIDIGTTGTDCDPSYPARIYNDGSRITRGAARIVYTRYDKNKNEIIDPDEKYLFYTYNHYNDFAEYLNYFGGWGKTFGNITGGGTLSSKKDYNPTPYVPVVLAKLPTPARSIMSPCVFLDFKNKKIA